MRPDSYELTGSSPATALIPDGFLNVLEPLRLGIDRRLGYTRDAAYVSFWMDGRQALAWYDGRHHGKATQARRRFRAEVVPLATLYGLNVETDAPSPQYALMLDRRLGWAYFAPRPTAVAFLNSQIEAVASPSIDVGRLSNHSSPAGDAGAPSRPAETWNGYRANTLIGAARYMRGDR